MSAKDTKIFLIPKMRKLEISEIFKSTSLYSFKILVNLETRTVNTGSIMSHCKQLIEICAFWKNNRS